MKYLRSFVFFTVFIFSLSATAEHGTRKGTVKYIRVHDDSLGAVWEPPVFWFALNGVSSVGECPVWNGNVLFIADSEFAYSLILGAYMGKQEIAVRFNDDYRNPAGYCIARHVTIGNPPPLQ